MRKIVLVIALAISSLMVVAAPPFNSYTALKTSEQYNLTAKTQFDYHCVNVINNIGIPSNTLDEKRVKYARAVLASNIESRLFKQALNYLTNDTYITNLSDWFQIENELYNNFANQFDLIFGIY